MATKINTLEELARAIEAAEPRREPSDGAVGVIGETLQAANGWTDEDHYRSVMRLGVDEETALRLCHPKAILDDPSASLTMLQIADAVRRLDWSHV